MAFSSPRQLLVLGALLVVLFGVLYWQLGGSPAAVPAQVRRVPPAGHSKDGALMVEAVRMDALTATRPPPGDGPRDPFVFEVVRPQPVSVAGGGNGPDGRMPVTEMPVGPPPPPPIQLKFIGIVNAASTSKIAVLSDGKNVFYGREGETVDGRYRIEHIGVESIEMARTDGQGRQVIRLSGS